MARLFGLLTVSLVLVACGGRHDIAVSDTLAESGEVPAGESELGVRSQEVLDAAIRADAPGCSAAVGIEGKVAWAGVRGIADMATGAKITTDTPFDIASVSKQFTATAVLLLSDAGGLTLDDSVRDHLPDLPEWATAVTVGQLINHTSGIPDYIDLLEDEGYQLSDRTTQADAVHALAAVPQLDFPPGSRFEYSNSNYLLLAEIVNKVSGEPLPEILRTQIFAPLDLAMVMNPGRQIPGMALPYKTDKSSAQRNLVIHSSWEQAGDGGIQTTPSQLVRWADNYRTGQVGGRQLLDAQLRVAVPTGPDSDERYGAGISVLPDGTLDHDGSWAGFVSDFRISADRRTALAISCNTEDHDPAAMVDRLAQLWN